MPTYRIGAPRARLPAFPCEAAARKAYSSANGFRRTLFTAIDRLFFCSAWLMSCHVCWCTCAAAQTPRLHVNAQRHTVWYKSITQPLPSPPSRPPSPLPSTLYSTVKNGFDVVPYACKLLLLFVLLALKYIFKCVFSLLGTHETGTIGSGLLPSGAR